MALENQKQIIIIAIAVVAGIGAVVLTSSYVTKSIQEKTQELSDKYEQQQKQVAAELQQRGDEQVRALSDKLNQVQSQQQQAIQQAAAAMKAAQESQKEAATKKANNSGALLTAKTPSGKRAITVLVDSLGAVGGLLNAGDFVDVIAHLDIPQEGDSPDKKNTVTAMVFQDLEVLAINTNLDRPGDYTTQQNAPSLKITFAVDPQEAGLLAFASKKGKLELALRAKNENDKENVKTSTWKTLADYVLQNQGASFDVPEEESGLKTETSENNKPYIQIFRGGKEL